MKTIFLILFVLLCIHVTADEIYTVDASGLNVRECPGKECGIIGKLEKGQEVALLDEEHGWARIRFNGSEGFVASRYLTNRNGGGNILDDTQDLGFFVLLENTYKTFLFIILLIAAIKFYKFRFKS